MSTFTFTFTYSHVIVAKTPRLYSVHKVNVDADYNAVGND